MVVSPGERRQYQVSACVSDDAAGTHHCGDRSLSPTTRTDRNSCADIVFIYLFIYLFIFNKILSIASPTFYV